MGNQTTYGNEPLGPAGLGAIPPCGHWWIYPDADTADRMHEVARFNVGFACTFCLGEWRAAIEPHARPAGTRVN
jgi:hypothetical protein